jgi:hypothetical protein
VAEAFAIVSPEWLNVNTIPGSWLNMTKEYEERAAGCALWHLGAWRRIFDSPLGT